MYISWSGWKLYDGCAYAYWHEYVAKTIVDKPDDRLGSIFGSAIGVLFELFYNEEWWRKSQIQTFMVGQVERVLEQTIQEEISYDKKRDRPGGVLLWKGTGEGCNPRGLYETQEDLETDVREAVGRGLKIIRHHRLLGRRAQAEVDLNSKIDGHILGGRADFVILRTRPHYDLCLLDGKGSRHHGLYIDPRQVKWYAMLYRHRFSKSPEKLGYVYWNRQPNTKTFDPEKHIDWVEFSEYELDQLMEQVLTSVREIVEGQDTLPPAEKTPADTLMELASQVFKPKPNENNCRFCRYATATTCLRGFGIVKEMNRRYGRSV